MENLERKLLLPPEGAPADYPVTLLWSGKEYDAFIENPALIDPATLEELRLNLVSDQTISSKLGVIDRGEGRINIITTGFTPQHERVSEAIVDLFIKN